MNVTFAQARKAYLKQKLMAALAMLLVAAVLLVSSTYAWLVLSTAPEVSNIKTQVGANGSLEIALLNTESWNDLTLLDLGDIDESATASLVDSNLSWGNLIDLSDSSYGLQKIVLNPSRLNIAANGSEDGTSTLYSVNSTILKTPVYGEDGRIQKLDTTSAVAYVYQDGQFSQEGYGVRAIGTSAAMGVFQLGMNSARSGLVTDTAAARTAASNTLSQNGGALANIVIAYALSGQTEGFTTDDVKAVQTLAEGMKSSLEDIEDALRQVFAGFITTENSGVSSLAYTTALETVMDENNSLSDLLAAYPAIAEVVPDIASYISIWTSDMNKVDTAIETCEEKIKTQESFDWEEISAIVSPLVDINQMTMGGQTITELKRSLIGTNGNIDMNKALELVGNGGLTITVPSGSGILSDIADFAGDYTAKVTIESDATVSGVSLQGMQVSMTTATSYSPVYLTTCSNQLKAATVTVDTGSNNAMTDFYGYAIDLAFRTNAESSDLLLQTESENRIYEGDTSNASLQGGGSTMSFITQAGLSATKMVKLMDGIRIVLMDADQNVLAIAKLDCTLGKDVYQELTDEEKISTGKWAYLSGGAGDYQISDLIDVTTYNALPEHSSVTFEPTTGKVTASLYLYDFSMTTNSSGDYTGGLTIGSKRSDAVITSLQQGSVQRLTAVVYLDGSVVNNSMVAADSAQSMTGTLNLQFSSSATLIPAENTALRQGDTSTDEESEVETQPST